MKPRAHGHHVPRIGQIGPIGQEFSAAGTALNLFAVRGLSAGAPTLPADRRRGPLEHGRVETLEKFHDFDGTDQGVNSARVEVTTDPPALSRRTP